MSPSDRAGASVEREQAIRNSLRASANHVVAFCELVLDELDNVDPADSVVETLRVLLLDGRELIGIKPEDVGSPATDIAGRTKRMLAGCMSVRQRLGGLGRVGLLNDLDQIEAAIRRVQQLVGAGLQEELGSASAVEVPAGPARVLVVDDDPIMREVLVRRLERLGHVVLQAADGREALDVLGAQPVDVVLTDLQMPEKGGFELLEEIKSDPVLHEIPAIMVSGAEDSNEAIRAIELGAEDFLPKPFDPTLLRARVGASVEKKRLRDHQRALVHRSEMQTQALADLNAKLELQVAKQVEEIGRLSRLERFLPPQIAEILISRGEEGRRLLESHRRQVAVLFCDLRGFTAFSEIAEPEDVMGVLREFHETLGGLVLAHEATVADFTGDGMMVFFNDPIPVPDPALRAAALALAWRQSAGELLGRWRRDGYDLGFSAGLSFGYATLGQIGFDRRYDYGVVGTVVNLAARLCGQANDGQILLTQRARRAMDEQAVVEDLGQFTFKGLREPVQVYSLLALAAASGLDRDRKE